MPAAGNRQVIGFFVVFFPGKPHLAIIYQTTVIAKLFQVQQNRGSRGKEHGEEVVGSG
jgi:hypothetical protein